MRANTAKPLWQGFVVVWISMFRKGFNPRSQGLAIDSEYVTALSYDLYLERFVAADEFERYVPNEKCIFSIRTSCSDD
jgi:hypothetical protein